MSKFKPKGRKNIPDVLLQFGRHLVCSEGTKTEPYYIENIKKRIASKYKCEPNIIEIIPVNKNGESTNTIHLVNFAKKDVKKRLNRGENINHVWIFFDKDDFPTSNFNSANNAINSMNNSDNEVEENGFKFNKETGISWHSCYSNESFELWFLLHYNLITTKLNRKQYIEKLENIKQLKEINFKYEKSKDNMFDIIINHGGNLNFAIKNAKKLCFENVNNNPSTAVYTFVEFFKNYMEL